LKDAVAERRAIVVGLNLQRGILTADVKGADVKSVFAAELRRVDVRPVGRRVDAGAAWSFRALVIAGARGNPESDGSEDQTADHRYHDFWA
jgi:hypothetical protein